MDVTVRICFRNKDGLIEDGAEDFDLSTFGGFLPSIGDKIVDPGVLSGMNRSDPSNREIWTVVERVFNPKDNSEYVALVVEARVPNAKERALLP
ncbi:hypothetical protein EDC40_10345 [Aminobacter aminovorans]|uniref:Uncharacterized protein n=1 Tax=Aminobacter aminovorans TaxID=83263 RepID=A0A380WLZ7_AMIAI|nr:hypothetical protein [Aminobacter aminovorans]TCS27580.1 hypothetical protein EDC40_10345 [Aminobacter aminovorans]SUU90007.1 Uncharacterised protein [Aminobacter aminovorans]